MSTSRIEVGPLQRQQRRVGAILLVPAVITVILVAVYPLAYTVVASLTESSLGRPFQRFVGPQQLIDAVTGEGALDPIVRSLAFALPSAVVAVLLGLCIALALDVAVRGRRLVRVVLLLPLMTPPVMAGVVWKLMLAPVGGLVNNVLDLTGITSDPVLFLGTSPLAMISVVVVDVWQWTPFCVLLIFAALQTMPTEVYEAAQVDGAGVVRSFLDVTLPLLLPTLLTVLLLKTIISFKVFDLVFIMTSGGPGADTQVASFDIYRTALQKFDLGTAAAETIVFIVLVSLVIAPLTVLRRRAQKAI